MVFVVINHQEIFIGKSSLADLDPHYFMTPARAHERSDKSQTSGKAAEAAADGQGSEFSDVAGREGSDGAADRPSGEN